MSDLTRRNVLRGAAMGIAATAFAGVALAAPSAVASRLTGNEPPTPSNAGGPKPFDEVFQGRRIQGFAQHGGHHHEGPGYAVLVDGEELHVMQNADTTWISVVNHYETFSTPRALARAAVGELQGAELVPMV
ncbi:apotyrosinase chaperone MelC1 [Streptomyces sp. H27-D2]|uniref:apotyrosinase chaperone MelC1 n=1 Tax=Streptomyces sp. H27-D2 TaxID=3046304 RepID=UPI002DB8E057|nr:tyrosinase cofactor [Streptomyces sp. H27-D2]MEC4015428.1 tyrosinase cofactor [Streptomyces sp. H27-D2]